MTSNRGKKDNIKINIVENTNLGVEASYHKKKKNNHFLQSVAVMCLPFSLVPENLCKVVEIVNGSFDDSNGVAEISFFPCEMQVYN